MSLYQGNLWWVMIGNMVVTFVRPLTTQISHKKMDTLIWWVIEVHHASCISTTMYYVLPKWVRTKHEVSRRWDGWIGFARSSRYKLLTPSEMSSFRRFFEILFALLNIATLPFVGTCLAEINIAIVTPRQSKANGETLLLYGNQGLVSALLAIETVNNKSDGYFDNILPNLSQTEKRFA